MESVQIGVSSTQLPGLWSWRGKASICQGRPGSLLTSYKLRKYSALETLFLQYVFPSTGSLKRMEAFGSHFFVRQCTKSPNHVFFPNHNFSPTSSPYDYLSLSPLFLSLSFYTQAHTHTPSTCHCHCDKYFCSYGQKCSSEIKAKIQAKILTKIKQ